LQFDLNDSVRDHLKLGGGITLAALLQNNINGHSVLTIEGLDLTGREEVERLKSAGYRLTDFAEACLKSQSNEGYTKSHRLVAGRQYEIAVVPGNEIADVINRRTNNLCKLAEKFGYKRPLGGVIPRIREVVSDEQMEKMGIWYIAALHEPMRVPGNVNAFGRVLRSRRFDGGRLVDAPRDYCDPSWEDGGAFAFFGSP
jgi:hypothetical protein